MSAASLLAVGQTHSVHPQGHHAHDLMRVDVTVDQPSSTLKGSAPRQAFGSMTYGSVTLILNSLHPPGALSAIMLLLYESPGPG